MAEKLVYDGLVGMIQGAVDTIRANHQHLSQLDSAIGDGDHGTAMLRSVEAISKGLTQGDGGDAKAMLFQIAWSVMSEAGGSTGPLLGSFLIGLSEGVGGKTEWDCSDLAAAFEAALAGLQKQSKARPGDKTMLDALIPAVAALRSAADDGKDIPAALSAAAEAAARGAESTKDMLAKFGKARNLGERTLGHVDPGSMSVTYLFQGFAEGAAKEA